MDIKSLKRYVEKPDVQSRILGSYDGPFSLGVSIAPNDPSELVFLLHVSDAAIPSRFRPWIPLDNGEEIRLVVCGGYVEPVFQDAFA